MKNKNQRRSNDKFDKQKGQMMDDRGTRNSGKSVKRRSRGRSYKGEEQELKSTTNHPAWYAADPALLADAANFPYAWPYGTRIPVSADCKAFSECGTAVPGVMAIEVVPTLGEVSGPTSPLNRAAQAVYSFIRHYNSGHANYEGVDLMLYIAAMSNVYAYINWCQRTFGMAMLYSQRNRYFPDAFMELNGVNADDVRANMADLRYGIQKFINQVATLVVPNNMSIFNRHAFLFQNIYCDGDDPKSQYYMFTPSGFYKYKPTTSTKGGMLLYEPMPKVEGGMTVADILEYGDNLISGIFGVQDLGIMAGDIIKAYGQNVIKLSDFPFDYMVTPVKDDVVLEQFKNAVFIRECVDAKKRLYNMYPQNYVQNHTAENYSYIMETYDHAPTTVTAAEKAYTLSKDMEKVIPDSVMITTSHAAPTPSDTMENTRLVHWYVPSWSNPIAAQASKGRVVQGTEAIQCIKIATMVNTNYADNSKPTIFTINSSYDRIVVSADVKTTPSINELQYIFDTVHLLSNFKYAPRYSAHLQFAMKNGTTLIGTGDWALPTVWDVDNYAVITAEELERLHEVATMSQFHVPLLGKN